VVGKPEGRPWAVGKCGGAVAEAVATLMDPFLRRRS
jgi:hypothetical protein